MRSLGVDVGGARKGSHAVLLDGRRVERRESRLSPDVLAALIAAERPDVVAIDAPCSFAQHGASRVAERDLNKRGIRLFFTPDEAVAREHPFYEWMIVGMDCFGAAHAAGYGSDTALEVFPHASAVTILGALPPPRSSKVRLRREVLESAGVGTPSLRNVDEVDAALAALTGIVSLEGGATAVGDASEGTITVPTKNLLPRYTR